MDLRWSATLFLTVTVGLSYFIGIAADNRQQEDRLVFSSRSSHTPRSQLRSRTFLGRKKGSSLKNRGLFDDIVAGLGSQTSFENNFLNIQSGNTKFTQTNNGPVVGGGSGPILASPGPGGPVTGNAGGLPPQGQFAQGLAPSPIPTNCECTPAADCRDISGLARSVRRFNQNFCALGTVVCCADSRPPPPVIHPPPQVVSQPFPVRPPIVDGPQGGPPPPIVGGPVGEPVRGPPFVGGNGQILPIGQCGRKGGNPLARVLDAESPENAAEFGEYPWMAAILRVDLSYVCGGALIDVNLVVTAAHCVAKVKFESLIVRLGEFDVTEDQEPPYQDIPVKNVIINSGYHSGTLRNDIALLVLAGPAEFNGYIKPVCMPPPGDLSGFPCAVSGWGKHRPREPFSHVLRETSIPAIDNGRCESMLRQAPELGPVFNLHPSMMCAGLPGKDACFGDGGSPLVCNVDGAWRLAGIVSWGIGCGVYPGVYTRVAAFVPWMMEVAQRV